MANDDEQIEQDEAAMKLALRIAGLVRTLRYGSVEIVVHDSRVVLVTRTEKVKLSESVDRFEAAR